jgi:phytoene dehydrogenase-like protein
MHDVAIIGGGHNGLVAAALLARAGRRTVVLERADRVGGCAITAEVAPGFRVPALAHRAAIDAEIVRALGLEQHGLHMLRSNVVASAPAKDGRLLTLWRDRERAAKDVAAFSPRDANRYPRFLDSFAAVSAVIRSLTRHVPPAVDETSATDLIALLKTLRAFRALPKPDAYRLLRWLPMPVADLAHEWFESEPLGALLGAGGVFGSFLGPRSPGSAAVLLLRGSGEGHPFGRGWTPQGGMSALADALAASARASGAEIRTGATVREVVVRNGVAVGVNLGSGEEVKARRVVSGLDPRRTFGDLIDAVHLPRAFVADVRRIRMRGTLAKVNFALSAAPRFAGLEAFSDGERAAVLSSAIRLCPDLDTMERAFDAAKYGQCSDEPWIELTVPSAADSGLAPGPGGHVASAYVQFVPHRLGEGAPVEAERLRRVVIHAIDKYAPGFARSVMAADLITPADLERTYGLTGGHIFHGELALDQLFIARPLLGWARFATPIRHLFLCGAGTHPGTGLDGRSGALAAKEILRTWSASSRDDS